MKTYLVTRRRCGGLAAEMKAAKFPIYQIVACSESEAKKIACRLDRQDEYFYRLYMATEQKKRRSAATDRRTAPDKADTTAIKTKNIITQTMGKCKRKAEL